MPIDLDAGGGEDLHAAGEANLPLVTSALAQQRERLGSSAHPLS